MAERHSIALVPGDGIGPEVVAAATRVLDAVAERRDFTLQWTEFPWGSEHYRQMGSMMAPDGIEQLAAFDAIFLGAVGDPGVPDHVSLWGLLIPIRRAFDQYVNVRPIRLLPGIASPLDSTRTRDIDFVCIRENSEGEYSEIGGRLFRGTDRELAIQEAVFTRIGVERVLRHAFDLAGSRGGRVLSATKSNGIIHTMPFWDELFQEMAGRYPDVEAEQMHVDALAAKFVLSPDSFDVVVASNLFGDILTDLGAAVVGSIGIAPSANLNPERDHPSMFEPIHGSAPDIVGRGIANPIGQVWAGAMMLEHLGHAEATADVMQAIESTLANAETRTPDLGGTASTAECGAALIAALEQVRV